MKHYKNITCFENRRRLAMLIKFRDDVVLYFNNSTFSWYASRTQETEEAQRARREINLKIKKISEILSAAGIDARMRSPNTPFFDIIENIFGIYHLDVEPRYIVDYLERAIGVYELDYPRSVIRMFNPIWWGLQILNWIAYLPIRIWGAIGFDEARAEQSILGRLSKLIFPVAGIMEILHFMGWLDTVKRIFGIGP